MTDQDFIATCIIALLLFLLLVCGYARFVVYMLRKPEQPLMSQMISYGGSPSSSSETSNEYNYYTTDSHDTYAAPQSTQFYYPQPVDYQPQSAAPVTPASDPRGYPETPAYQPPASVPETPQPTYNQPVQQAFYHPVQPTYEQPITPAPQYDDYEPLASLTPVQAPQPAPQEPDNYYYQPPAIQPLAPPEPEYYYAPMSYQEEIPEYDEPGAIEPVFDLPAIFAQPLSDFETPLAAYPAPIVDADPYRQE